VHMDPDILKQWITGYDSSKAFKRIWTDVRSSGEEWTPGYRFFKDKDNLLYFKDADHNPRLCVPESFQERLLKAAHETASESAH
ncbi:hypothetical protein GALMADRAFT_33500, partial [Galerina marginata CBS 339.88]